MGTTMNVRVESVGPYQDVVPPKRKKMDKLATRTRIVSRTSVLFPRLLSWVFVPVVPVALFVSRTATASMVGAPGLLHAPRDFV